MNRWTALHRCGACRCNVDPTRRLFTGALLAAGAGMVLPATAMADATSLVSTLLPKANEVLDREYPALDALYKDIHANPEIAFQEKRTSAKLGAELQQLGFTVTLGVGQTGLVGILRNGSGPMVMVRTELDGLPMEEASGLPYASRVKTVWNNAETPVAHSCGHDLHMAAWIGTAKVLAALRSEWKGTLMFVGQPAEETLEGAKRMLQDDLFGRFGKPDAGFALHAGGGAHDELSYAPGVRSSSADSLEVVFKGRGGHGSMPNLTIDPIMMASRFVVDVQSVISREKNAADFGVITIGAVQAGSVGNIIPDSATLRGTLRSYKPEVRQLLRAGVERTAKAVADMAGASAPEVRWGAGAASVISDAALTEKTAAVFKAMLGNKAQLQPQPAAASEDFSELIAAGVPCVFYGIGSLDPAAVAAARAAGRPLPANHSPRYAPVPEPTIRMGVRTLSMAALNVLKG